MQGALAPTGCAPWRDSAGDPSPLRRPRSAVLCLQACISTVPLPRARPRGPMGVLVCGTTCASAPAACRLADRNSTSTGTGRGRDERLYEYMCGRSSKYRRPPPLMRYGPRLPAGTPAGGRLAGRWQGSGHVPGTRASCVVSQSVHVHPGGRRAPRRRANGLAPQCGYWLGKKGGHLPSPTARHASLNQPVLPRTLRQSPCYMCLLTCISQARASAP